MCLHKFLGDDFEYAVVNNSARDKFAFSNARAVCAQMGIRELVPGARDDRTPNYQHSCALQWLLGHEILPPGEDGIAVILDFDMFLMRPFSFVDFLGDHVLAGQGQSRGPIDYVWPGFVVMRPSRMPERNLFSLACGKINDEGVAVGEGAPGHNVDVGGLAHVWMRRHREHAVKPVRGGRILNSMGNTDVLPAPIRAKYSDDFGFDVFEDSFLHYGRGTNWDNMPLGVIEAKDKLAFFYIEEVVAGRMPFLAR